MLGEPTRVHEHSHEGSRDHHSQANPIGKALENESRLGDGRLSLLLRITQTNAPRMMTQDNLGNGLWLPPEKILFDAAIVILCRLFCTVLNEQKYYCPIQINFLLPIRQNY